MTLKNKPLFPSFCRSCKVSRGLKRKDRIIGLCRTCSFKQTSATKLINSLKNSKIHGLSNDVKIIKTKDGKNRILFKMHCSLCLKDKGYGLKQAKNALCAKCAAAKGAIKNKGMIPPNKGTPLTHYLKVKISCAKQGIALHEFNGFVTPIEQQLRTLPIVKQLRLECYKRDAYTCQLCFTKGVSLNAHHLNSWKHHPSQRFELSNLITLCKKCHIAYHETYGKGLGRSKLPNTKEQFLNFKESYGKK
jgi:hypothetical protein